ncbi:MAG: DUF2812 domain-containing protein [Acutalibacteraceae bacterium]
MKNKDKNTITKFKMFYDLDKELEYINQMNKQGWKLVYIKGGCYYTFVRTQPDEYFTTMYADEKNKISQVTAFAAQCGYESIPHTMDGFGNLLYLTGKKGRVSEEFACDRESKIKFAKKTSIFYMVNSIACMILALLLILESSLYLMLLISEFNAVLASVGIIVFVVTLLMTALTILAFRLTFKSRKKIKQLKTEAMIYE